MEKLLSESFARLVTDLNYEALPTEVVEGAKSAILDQLGCQLIGSTLEWNKIPYRYIRDLAGRPEATIVNHGTRTLVHDAAYVNAVFGQGAELDDIIFSGGGHAGAETVPVALALAEREHLSGKEFINAVVVGYEIAARIGRLMYPGIMERGFHPQSVIGVFAAAAVTGKLLGLSQEEIVQSFSIAGSHCSGTQEYDLSGGEVKRVHAGKAVRDGIQSAMLAHYGLTGPRTIFEGKRGVCQLFAGQCKTERAMEGVGKEWGILNRIVKLYPCVATHHSSLDVWTRMISENHIEPGQVDKIAIRLHENFLIHGASIVEPQDILGAQFSLAYSLAIRLVKGSNDLELYQDSALWRDPRILDLAHRVEVKADPEIAGGRRFASRMRVTLKDGRVLEGAQDQPKGSPGNPLTKDEAQGKFRLLASRALPMPQVEAILETVARLDQLSDMAQLVPLLVNQTQGL